MESDEGEYGIKWFELSDEYNVGVCSFTNKVAFLTSTRIEILGVICDSIEISEEEDDLVCEISSGCYCETCPYCNISFEDMVEKHSAEKIPDGFASEIRELINRWEKQLQDYEKEHGELKPGVYGKGD